MTGYERYILTLFSKNKNFLSFNGTSQINVIDAAGVNFPDSSKDDTGTGVLDPNDNNFSFELFVYPSAVANNNQIILQKRKDANNANASKIFFIRTDKVLKKGSYNELTERNRIISEKSHHP